MDSPSSAHQKMQLTSVQETLVIPLYARALDFRSEHPILNDAKADEIVRSIDYDFVNRTGFGEESLVIRAKHYDDWTREFLKGDSQAVVMNAGCGLDARILRVDPSPRVRWFDVDYPQVIELRKKFYKERDGYQMIASPLTDPAWLDLIPQDLPIMFVADGVLEYLTRDDVAALLNRITDRFPRGQLAFDVMTPFAVRSAAAHLHDESGPLHKWAVEDLQEINALDAKLERMLAFPLFASPLLRGLSLRSRLFYGAMCLLPRFRNLLRLVRYRF